MMMELLCGKDNFRCLRDISAGQSQNAATLKSTWPTWISLATLIKSGRGPAPGMKLASWSKTDEWSSEGKKKRYIGRALEKQKEGGHHIMDMVVGGHVVDAPLSEEQIDFLEGNGLLN